MSGDRNGKRPRLVQSRIRRGRFVNRLPEKGQAIRDSCICSIDAPLWVGRRYFKTMFSIMGSASFQSSGKESACPVFGTSGIEKGGFLREEPAFLKGLLEVGAYTMP